MKDRLPNRWQWGANGYPDENTTFDLLGTTSKGGGKYRMVADFWFAGDNVKIDGNPLEESWNELANPDKRREFIKQIGGPQTGGLLILKSYSITARRLFSPKKRSPSESRITEYLFRFQSGKDRNPPYAKLASGWRLGDDFKSKAKEKAEDFEEMEEIVTQLWMDRLLDPEKGIQIVLTT